MSSQEGERFYQKEGTTYIAEGTSLSVLGNLENDGSFDYSIRVFEDYSQSKKSVDPSHIKVVTDMYGSVTKVVKPYISSDGRLMKEGDLFLG